MATILHRLFGRLARACGAQTIGQIPDELHRRWLAWAKRVYGWTPRY